MGRRLGGHLLGRPRGDREATLLAALRAHVDDPVGALDHVEVVLDHDHAVARLDEAPQNVQQPLHVGEMEPRGGLIEDVQRAPGGDLGQLRGQLHALGLAPGQRRRGLAEAHVAQPHGVQRVIEAGPQPPEPVEEEQEPDGDEAGAAHDPDRAVVVPQPAERAHHAREGDPGGLEAFDDLHRGQVPEDIVNRVVQRASMLNAQ